MKDDLNERRHSQDELLARIDERTGSHSNQLATLFEKLDKYYVTKEEFNPVKNVAFGLAALLMMGVIFEILKMAFRQG